MEGSVDLWSTRDGGLFWERSGVAVPHEKGTNRIHVAAGRTQKNELVVVASGWKLTPSENPTASAPMEIVSIVQAHVSISSDGGKTWKTYKNGFPPAETGMSEFVPFGDVLHADDGSLRMLAYATDLDHAFHRVSMFRSDDGGRSWGWLSHLGDDSKQPILGAGHNETALFKTGNQTWIAAARRWKSGAPIDLFTSEDDGRTWQYSKQLTREEQHPGHITSLENGDLLLTYGNRIPGEYGVAVKFSSDLGKTWSEEYLLVDDLKSRDCGYPSSIQLSDGSVLTAYYSDGNAVHDRYHMGSVIWKVP
jgi:Neuraminidase (sialidase)